VTGLSIGREFYLRPRPEYKDSLKAEQRCSE
jgi:hypothetical protein